MTAELPAWQFLSCRQIARIERVLLSEGLCIAAYNLLYAAKCMRADFPAPQLLETHPSGTS